MTEQIKSFLSKERNNSIAPRLPDIRLQIFGEVVNNILKTLVEIIDKNCKTNKNKFETSTERKFRLIIFDNTVLNNNPIFDSQDKNKNLKKIKKKIIDKYSQKNNCKL